jgi:protein involved in polysaccharide export with SLBB domain
LARRAAWLLGFCLVGFGPLRADDADPNLPDNPDRTQGTGNAHRGRDTDRSNGADRSNGTDRDNGNGSGNANGTRPDGSRVQEGDESDQSPNGSTRRTKPKQPTQPGENEGKTKPGYHPKAWDYYPERPTLTTPNPELEAFLDELDKEAEHLVPLFGQQLFRRAVIERALRENDTPAVAQPSPSYRLAPGDRVTIVFYNKLVDPVTVKVVVQGDGQVAFDPVGAVPVAGLSVDQFEQTLTRLIRLRGPRDATVEFAFTSLHELAVTVGGEVRRQAGRVVLGGYATLFDALAESGGPKAYASLRHIKLFRGDQVQEVDLYRFLLDGDPQSNPSLRDGDSIHVPLAQRLVTVDGGVKRPARFELRDEQSLRQALALAGGLTAAGTNVQMTRVTNHQSTTLLDLPADDVLAGRAAVAAVEPLIDGDRVHVVELDELPTAVVRVEGAVLKPGVFGYHPGMTLGEALELAQGPARSGYGAIGTIRRVQPDGQIENVNFAVAEVLAKGPAAARALAPNDRVVLDKGEQRVKITVFARGAVNKPGQNLSAAAETVADLLKAVGGLAPNAALGRALLESHAGGGEEEDIAIDLSEVPRGGSPKPNPTLSNGDVLRVPFLADVGLQAKVRVEGQVRHPGSFDLTKGMTVRDLLAQAGGRLPRAAQRGNLQSVLAGTRQTTFHYLDLARAEAGEAADNPVLAEDDLLQVFNAETLDAAVPQVVSVTGAVVAPGQYPFGLGMRISDLLRAAGGPRPEADRETAVVSRLADRGRTRNLTINLARAVAGERSDDLELLAGDVLEVQVVAEITLGQNRVLVTGAVLRPGPVRLVADMVVEDLLRAAGGLLDEAYQPRAELRRRGDADPSLNRSRVIPVDLTHRPCVVPVQAEDVLRVYTKDQAVWHEPTVFIRGDVQRPGVIERTEGMKLSDALFAAGGLVGNPAFKTIEVARVSGKETVRFGPDVERLLKSDPAQDLDLADGDRIYVRTAGDYLDRPMEVLVHGKVKTPGFQPITADVKTVSQLIDKVGLLTDEAFLEGTILLRRADEVVNAEQARYVSEFYRETEVQRRRDDMLRLTSRGGSVDLLTKLESFERPLPTDQVQDLLLDPFGSAERAAEVQSDLEKLTKGAAGARVAQTKESSSTTSLTGYVRVALDVASVLSHKQDLELRPNDILVVPAVPQLILVEGEVNSQVPLPYVLNRTVWEYITMAGGPTRAADLRQILLVHADGRLEVVGPHHLVKRGDIITVPHGPVQLPKSEGEVVAEWNGIAALLSSLGTMALTLVEVLK